MEHQHPPLSNEVGPQKRSSSCPSSLLGNHYHLFSSNPHLTSGPRELECLPFPKRPSTAFQVLLPNPPRTPAPKAAVPSTATPFFMKVIYLSNLGTNSLSSESHTPIHLPSLSACTFLLQRASSFRSVLEGSFLCSDHLGGPSGAWHMSSKHSPTQAFASTCMHFFRNIHLHSCIDSFRHSHTNSKVQVSFLHSSIYACFGG